jgi:hypothetical protein
MSLSNHPTRTMLRSPQVRRRCFSLVPAWTKDSFVVGRNASYISHFQGNKCLADEWFFRMQKSYWSRVVWLVVIPLRSGGSLPRLASGE